MSAIEALIDDLKPVLRRHMHGGQTEAEIEHLHLQTIRWLAMCCILGSGTSRDGLCDEIDAAVESVRGARS